MTELEKKGDDMERRFMHAIFDVTELSEAEIDALGLEVGVQAEAGESHRTVPYPTFAYSWTRPAWPELPAEQAAKLAECVTAALTERATPLELYGIDVRPVTGQPGQWEVVVGVRDHDDDCDRTFITRISSTGEVDDSYESN